MIVTGTLKAEDIKKGNNRNRNHSFYTSKKWKQKKSFIMRKYKYECQEARRYGKTETAEMIHHIYPLKDYPDLKFETWNLLPLTNKNHNKMHNRLTDELTALGKYWQKKRERDFHDFYNPPVLDKKMTK